MSARVGDPRPVRAFRTGVGEGERTPVSARGVGNAGEGVDADDVDANGVSGVFTVAANQDITGIDAGLDGQDEGNEGDENDENDEGNEGDENDEGDEGDENDEGDEGDEDDEGDEGDEDDEGDEGDEGDENDEGDEGDEGDENLDPVAADDAAETCYDESAHVDVLANDTDANSDNLTITAVNGQAIVEGGPAVDVAGVMVTLESGKLVVDGSTAYADLIAGEEETTSFTYSVSDGNGGSATATASVTFNGATDTLEKVDAELTQGLVGLQITADDFNVGNGTDSGAFTIKLSDADDESGVYAKAYCLDIFAPMLPGGFGTNIDNAYTVGATLDVADEDFLNDDQEDFLSHNGINGETGVENLDLINWIINQDFENTDNGDGTATTYTGAEVQGAIWALTNGEQLESYGEPGGVYVDAAYGTVDNAQEIVDLALANGEGFEAGEGDIVGVFVDPVTSPGFTQPFIVGIDLFDEGDC